MVSFVPRYSSVVGVLLVIMLAAPEPDLGPCDWDDSLMTEFDVADRADIPARIPGLGRTPELTGAGDIIVNGRPAGLAIGPLHVRVMRCIRSDQVALLPPLIRGEPNLPTMIHGVVAVTTASGDLTLFASVSLGGLR